MLSSYSEVLSEYITLLGSASDGRDLGEFRRCSIIDCMQSLSSTPGNLNSLHPMFQFNAAVDVKCFLKEVDSWRVKHLVLGLLLV